MIRLLIAAFVVSLWAGYTQAATWAQIEAEKAAQAQQRILNMQRRHLLACFYKIREGTGWCNKNPTGRPDYAAGRPCDCGRANVNWPVQRTILETPGTLRARPPGNAINGFNLDSRFNCDSPGRSAQGLC
jgi:hypothetical protein